MRPPEAAVRLLVLAATVAILATGCSRLTFIKADASRGKTRQVAQDYSFRTTPEDRRRTEAATHVSRADRALVAGEFDAAAGHARDALRVDPKSADALTLLAVVAVRNGRTAEAGDYYRRAAEAAPDNGLMLNNYGAWLCGNARAAEAMGYFDRAIADPRYGRVADAMANAGACAEAAGQPGRVERDLRFALGLDPANTVALSAMADYQYRSGRFLEARAFSERRLAAAPATGAALLLASQIETRLGDMAAAGRYRQRLEREFPRALSESSGESSQL
ncbi:tetratricopeptide repeat protein [Luteimonas yindakuii]|uniref:tetratricopeptide repeat protein n=1 Tax=Luteimonas yindakuii TaxID=2565782 RepID=UPI0010A4EEDB|nr:tetratricopeptide repeat protein [Luteimonas yindakuii]QCO67648.1 tetratricopeptide repeat protein [Luteimonas yindakuii]